MQKMDDVEGAIAVYDDIVATYDNDPDMLDVVLGAIIERASMHVQTGHHRREALDRFIDIVRRYGWFGNVVGRGGLTWRWHAGWAKSVYLLCCWNGRPWAQGIPSTVRNGLTPARGCVVGSAETGNSFGRCWGAIGRLSGRVGYRFREIAGAVVLGSPVAETCRTVGACPGGDNGGRGRCSATDRAHGDAVCFVAAGPTCRGASCFVGSLHD